MCLRGPRLNSSKDEAFLPDNSQTILEIDPPNPYVRPSIPFLSSDRSSVLLCAFQEAFLLKARTDDASEFTRELMCDASSEIRKRQRLRSPLPIGCAGRWPSRAIFFIVTGLIRRNLAASSGATNGSLSSVAFTYCSTSRPFSLSDGLALALSRRVPLRLRDDTLMMMRGVMSHV